MSGLRGVGDTGPAGERGLVLQPARRPGGGGGGGRAGFGKMDGWTGGPADGVSDARGGRGGRVRVNTSGLRTGAEAGRWLEEDGGMEGQMEAQLDATERWQGEPLAKWMKRMECPRAPEGRARQTQARSH